MAADLIIFEARNGWRPSTAMLVYVLPGGHPPTRRREHDAGYDVYANERVVLAPGAYARIALGFHAALPYGYAARLTSRSSTQFVVREGVIEPGFRGEWRAPVQNLGKLELVVNPGDRIAQILVFQIHDLTIVPVGSVDALPSSERGSAGWGSSGGVPAGADGENAGEIVPDR